VVVLTLGAELTDLVAVDLVGAGDVLELPDDEEDRQREEPEHHYPAHELTAASALDGCALRLCFGRAPSL
jgi:hypothetical protein